MEENSSTLISEPIAELIALAAAMAANNEDVFQQANYRLHKLGVSREDRIKAVNLAIKVKMLPHNNLMDMAQGYLAGSGPEGGCSGDCDCESPDACSESGCDCGCGH